MTIYEAIGAFIENRRKRGATEGTRTTYWYQLRALARWLAQHELDQDITRTGADQLARYIEFIKARPLEQTNGRKGHLAADTVRHWVLHLRIFFKFLHDDGHIEQPVYKHIAVPRKSKNYLPKVLQPVEVNRLLSVEMSARDRAIVYLMLDSALRLSEVCALNKTDIDLEQMVAFVRHGKGDKARYVVFSSTTADAMRAWLVAREADDEPALFIGYDPINAEKNGQRLKPRGLRKMIAKLGQRASLRVHPHMLRHTAITRYLDNGGSLQDAAMLAGHAEITTTMIYTHVSMQSLRRKHKQFSPLMGMVEETEARA